MQAGESELDFDALVRAHHALAPDSELGRRRLLELDHLLLDEGERSLFECERVPRGSAFLIEHVPASQPSLLCALSREHRPLIVGRLEWKAEGEVQERHFEPTAR